MRAKRSYRDREPTQVAVLDALVERGEEGMTVLELRAAVDADIEAIERALPQLKRDGLIEVSADGGEALIRPDGRVMPSADGATPDQSLAAWLRERLPF